MGQARTMGNSQTRLPYLPDSCVVHIAQQLDTFQDK